MVDTPTPASVRRKLNEQFESLALFKRDRGTALFHFCAALELIPTPISDNPDLAMAKGRHAIEASMRAIPAIFRLCPAIPIPKSPEVNPALLAEASELVELHPVSTKLCTASSWQIASNTVSDTILSRRAPFSVTPHLMKVPQYTSLRTHEETRRF